MTSVRTAKRSHLRLAHNVIKGGLKYQMAVLKVLSIVELKFVELKMGLLALEEENTKMQLKIMTVELIKASPIARKDYKLSVTVI